MTLDDGQRRDLIAFATDTSDPTSAARAQELLATSFEARAFMANVVTLGKVLRPQSHERLSPSAAAELAASIRQRAAQRPARGRKWSVRRLLLPLAIAASLVILIGESLWLGLGRTHDMAIGSVAYLPTHSNLGVPQNPQVTPLQSGETVKPPDETAVIVLNDGGRMAVSVQSQVRIHDPRSATLDVGRLYWDCPTHGTLTAGAGILRLLQGQAEVFVNPQMATWSLFQGSASVDIFGRRELLSAGEMLITPEGGEVVRMPAGKPPGWALQALQKQAESEIDKPR